MNSATGEKCSYVEGQLIEADVGALVGSRNLQGEWRVVEFLRGPNGAGQIYIRRGDGNAMWVWTSWTRTASPKALEEHAAKVRAKEEERYTKKLAEKGQRVMKARVILDQLIDAHERFLDAHERFVKVTSPRNEAEVQYQHERFNFAFDAALEALTREDSPPEGQTP